MARKQVNCDLAVRQRTVGRPMLLSTIDEHRPYKEAVFQASWTEATTTPSGLPTRPPHQVAPPSLYYAAVHKVRRLARVA